jgi:hypothetical protein
MITDSQLTLSASQAVTASAVSGNTIDLQNIRDTGAGEELNIYVNVEVAATAAGAATVNFQVITSASANLSSPTIIGQTDAIPKALLVVGAQISIPLPRSFINQLGQRFLGLQYTVGTGPLTAGTFSAGVIVDAADNTSVTHKTYPSGFSVK